MNRLNYWWRVLMTGLCFLIFGVGGLLMGLVVYPLLLLLTNENNRPHYGQLIIHHAFRLFIGLMQFVGIMTIEVQHRERLHTPNQFFIANHPTLIDVVILLSMLKQCDCVVKAHLSKNMATKGPLKAAGYIENNSPDALLEQASRILKQGHHLLVFPEGTRTRNLQALKFKRGAALVALQSGHPVTPISINCVPRMLAKGQKWYKIPASKPHFTIKVGLPMRVDIPESVPTSVGSRRLNKTFIDYFNEELNIGFTNQRIEKPDH